MRAKSNLRGTAREVSKIYKQFKRLSEKGQKVRTVLDVYERMAKNNAEYKQAVNQLGIIKDFNVSNLKGYSTQKIIHSTELMDEIKRLEKVIIKKTKNGEMIRTTGEIRKAVARNASTIFSEEMKRNKGAEGDKNSKLYYAYKFFLKFGKYKALQKTMNYEDFNTLLLNEYNAKENPDAVKTDLNIYKKAEEIYNKLRDIKKEWELSNPYDSEDKENMFFFGRPRRHSDTHKAGYEKFQGITKEVYGEIMKILKNNKNITVDDAVKQIISKEASFLAKKQTNTALYENIK